MKKLYVVLALSLAICSDKAYAACMGPFCWDDTGFSIKATGTIDGVTTFTAGTVNSAGVGLQSRTLAQINQITPTAGKGEMLYCSDCATAAVCVSSGTGKGGYTVITSTTTHCGA